MTVSEATLVGECDHCGRVKTLFEFSIGWLCGDCESILRDKELREDVDNYCHECGVFSEILHKGACPMCSEMGLVPLKRMPNRG